MDTKEAEKEMIEKSFICEDKKIHFGKLHVVYIRDAIEIIKKIKEN